MRQWPSAHPKTIVSRASILLDFAALSAQPSSTRLERRAARVAAEPAPSGLGLSTRRLGLGLLRTVYGPVLNLAGLGLLALGGAVPVLKRWLSDEPVGGWSGALQILGGVPVHDRAADPDADLGPLLRRRDAPELFAWIAEIARRLGVQPPAELRLAYLPCCGVVAGPRAEALLVGLPLLQILSRGELRAVLAHELAHLARGDATGAARSARFVAALSHGLETGAPTPWSPLRWWAVAVERLGTRWIAPLARGQEVRADRVAAGLAGGPAAADALVQVALVQPLFREVLAVYDPDRPGLANLYTHFRRFWNRLPEPLRESMRHRLLTDADGAIDPAHPPLPDRTSAAQAHPGRSQLDDHEPASGLVCDLEALEQWLHDRLFATSRPEPSVFHRAGS